MGEAEPQARPPLPTLVAMSTQSLSPGAKVAPADKLGRVPTGTCTVATAFGLAARKCWGRCPFIFFLILSKRISRAKGHPARLRERVLGACLLQQLMGEASQPVTRSRTPDRTLWNPRGTGSTHRWPWPNFTCRASGSVGSESWAGGGPSLGRRAHNPKYETILRLDQDEKKQTTQIQ